jgi:two-component system chemotaxis response regulator CheB
VTYRIVVIGTSWGGLAALRQLASGLPRGFGLPVVVVQHRHRQSDHLLTTLLQDHSALPVCDVEDKAPICPGSLYVAPADYHLLIEPDHFALSTEEPVRYSRPSIDVTFMSAAHVYGAGPGGGGHRGPTAFGAGGRARIARRGGLALVQTPATAESPAMPAAALRAVPEARALTIAEIGSVLIGLAVAEHVA